MDKEFAPHVLEANGQKWIGVHALAILLNRELRWVRRHIRPNVPHARLGDTEVFDMADVIAFFASRKGGMRD